MDLTRYRIINELLGDNNGDYIASDLKETYEDLKETLKKTENGNNYSVAIWSNNKEEEIKKIKELIDAIKIVYSWYSCDDIEK